jgi:hypothetical protein
MLILRKLMTEILLKGINLLEKKIRAELIRDHLVSKGLNRCVCFSCGHSAGLLEAEGLNVVYIGEKGILKPNKWFTPEEIQKVFNGLFDATSGNLNDSIMGQIAIRLREIKKRQELYSLFEKNPYFDLNSIDRFDPDNNTYLIPTGSGETIICLTLAFPQTRFVPIRVQGVSSTEFQEGYPLNPRLLQNFGTYTDRILPTYSQPK